MNCVRCKDPIDEDSNFCKKCGMEQDKDKNFEDYERDYLNRLENKDNPNNEGNSTPKSNNDYSPKVGRTYPQKESTAQKAVGYGIAAVIVVVLGILTGALLRAGSP